MSPVLFHRRNTIGYYINFTPDYEFGTSVENITYQLNSYQKTISSITVSSASIYSLLGISVIEPSVVTTIPIVE